MQLSAFLTKVSSCRGMVEMENGEPKRTGGRVTPSIDYPFAEDGLAIWYAMHKWFHDYLSLYYKNDEQVRLNAETCLAQSWS